MKNNKNMIYEQIIYTISDGRMIELIERFEKHTLRLFKKYDIKPVFFGVSKDNKNKFFYVLEFENIEHFKKSWDNFIQDKERIEIWDRSNLNGKLVVDIQSSIYVGVLMNNKK